MEFTFAEYEKVIAEENELYYRRINKWVASILKAAEPIQRQSYLYGAQVAHLYCIGEGANHERIQNAWYEYWRQFEGHIFFHEMMLDWFRRGHSAKADNEMLDQIRTIYPPR